MTASNEEKLRQAAELFRTADSILFITGAGISVDSGLPTYRGVGGLYDNEETDDGMPIEVALSGSTFNHNPGLTWRYLWEIGEACFGARPNAAHKVIAELEKDKSKVTVMTQNVDGLHRQAGSSDLIEVHGNMHQLYCTTCKDNLHSNEFFDPAKTVLQPSFPITCMTCGGIIRPDVVLFGEFLSNATVGGLGRIAQHDYDLTVSIGTSAVFPYILEPVVRAAAIGRATIEINPGMTDLTETVGLHIPLGAAEALTRIAGRMADF